MIAMWVIWFLAIYGLSTILVHMARRWNHYYAEIPKMNVQLLLYNSEHCLEGAIRSLVHLSRLEGRPIHMKVYDFGSTDRTAEILQTLQNQNPFLFDRVQVVTKGHVSLVSYEEEPPNQFLTIDLREGLRTGEVQTT